MALSHRFEDALVFAHQLHRDQYRKGTNIPYFSHLLGVTSLVLEAGGDEDEAIAALLHDAVEDQGGQSTLKEIRNRFGDRVAKIVEGCTDADTTPRPPWRQRKERYLAYLSDASPEIRRVSLADKLHNARTILRDYRQLGEAVWDRFSGGREGTLWYYNSLLAEFLRTRPFGLTGEFERVVKTINQMARGSFMKDGA